jgi:hypothetical protein
VNGREGFTGIPMPGYDVTKLTLGRTNKPVN